MGIKEQVLAATVLGSKDTKAAHSQSLLEVEFDFTAPDLILSETTEVLQGANKADFPLGQLHDDRCFPDAYKEQSCTFTGTFQVLNIVVGHAGPAVRIMLLRVAGVGNRDC